MQTRLVRRLALAIVLVGSVSAQGSAQSVQGHGSATADAKVNVIVVMDQRLAVGGHAERKAQAAQFARGFGLQPQVTYGTALLGFAASVPEGRLNAMQRDPRVLHVEVDKILSVPRRVEAGQRSGSASLGQTTPWGVERVCGSACATGSEVPVDVYILDTGIDADHPDLPRLASSVAFENCRGKRCKAAWDDDNGHGTHVAGTVAALNNGSGVVGIAPGVSLHSVKVLNGSGSGWLSRIIAGIDWVADNASSTGRPAVANMSLGGSGSKSGRCTSTGFSGTDAYHRAICNAAGKGVVFVVAAGNSGIDAENAVPAAYDDAVITVSATQQASGGKQDWPAWSNWGNGMAGGDGTLVAAPVAIAAPGVSILSTCFTGGTCTMSGTSMASPHVAGAAAVVLRGLPRAGNYEDLSRTRNALRDKAENTADLSAFLNTSGRNHPEGFLNARPATGS